MNKSSVLVVGLAVAGVLLYLALGDRRQDTCDDASAQALAKLYVELALPLGGLRQTLATVPELYAPRGAVSVCARAHAEKLMQGALQGPSREEIYAQSMEVAASAGRPDLGQSVADGLMQSRDEMFLQAIYFNGIAEALDRAEGQVEALEQSEMGRLAAAMNTMFGMLCPLMDTSALQALCEREMDAIRQMTYQVAVPVLWNQIKLVDMAGLR
jgi:hypothetical protein